MMFRQLSIVICIAVPSSMALGQISVYDASYRLEADAYSGASSDSNVSFANNLGPVQSYFDQVDSYASESTSSVHSFANVSWLCTPTDLDAGLVACWDSVDLGAGNRGHMLSRINLGIRLTAVNFISTVAAFDPAHSTAAIDMWNGNSWVLLVNSSQIVSYSGFWNPGDYRLRAQRLYDPIGNSTGCVPLDFHLHAEPVPEPTSIGALSMGVALLIRRRNAKVA